MKYLTYTLMGIVALVVIYLAMGFVQPEVRYGHSITTSKSVQEAWAVTQDESKYKDWLAGFESMELISGEKGAVGSKYKIIVTPQEGQPPFEMIETVEEIKEFESVTMSFNSEAMDFEQTLFFEEAEGGSKVRSDSKVMGKGMFSKSMFALMESLGGAFTAQEVENFENLKKLIEANTTDYYPAPEVVAELPDSTLMEASESD